MSPYTTDEIAKACGVSVRTRWLTCPKYGKKSYCLEIYRKA